MGGIGVIDTSGKRRLLEVISKVPLFNDLTLYQAEKVLGLCRPRKYEVDQVLCDQGSASTEMFILLAGELGIVRDTATIATVTPVAPVGEMGILTGEPRTATVLARTESSVLVIRRVELESMMKRDLDISWTIMRNFSQTLSQRLSDSNISVEKYRHQVQELKREVIEQRRRAELLEQQLSDSALQMEDYLKRMQEVQKGKAMAEATPAAGVEGGPSPDDGGVREAVKRLIEQHLALLEAHDYKTAYQNLSAEAKYDVPWSEYEKIKKGIEDLGEIRRMTLEVFEKQRDEDLEFYYVKYSVDFATASGILELYLQQEDGLWKVSHDVVTAGGATHTV